MYPAPDEILPHAFSTHNTSSLKVKQQLAVRVKSGQQFWTDWSSLQSKTRQNHVILKIPIINKNIKQR